MYSDFASFYGVFLSTFPFPLEIIFPVFFQANADNYHFYFILSRRTRSCYCRHSHWADTGTIFIFVRLKSSYWIDMD